MTCGELAEPFYSFRRLKLLRTALKIKIDNPQRTLIVEIYGIYLLVQAFNELIGNDLLLDPDFAISKDKI
jgi:hypothetical protein